MKTQKRSLIMREKARAARERRRLLLASIGLGGLVIAVLVWFSFSQAGTPNVGPARVNARLDDFNLTDISGQKVQLSDYTGQVVLINAWATWCPPCRAEMPALNAYYQAHAAEGFVILAVNAGDSASEAASFARDYGLAFPVLLDPQTRLLNQLSVRSFPTSNLIGRDGVVKDIHIGMFTPDVLEAKLSPLLAQ